MVLTYFLNFEVAFNFDEIVDLFLEASFDDGFHGLGGHLELSEGKTLVGKSVVRLIF